jgi:hypothetical protein
MSAGEPQNNVNHRFSNRAVIDPRDEDQLP